MLPAKPTCCLLTNSGRGAVAVVGLIGEAAAITGVSDRLFAPVGSRSFQHLVDQSEQVIFYGQWKSTAEDLVVVKTQHGLEVHCHGGDAASAAIISDLRQTGCESVSKQQWRLLHGGQWRCETEAAICEATTVRTANLLLRVLTNQSESLSNLAAQIRNQQISAAIDSIQQALNWDEFGLGLTQPRSLVFCGQPNVGKSSLVNAIAGFQRSIVNSQAGTTRDVLSQSTAIDGWPVDLIDTAGLRASQDQIEAMGIEKAKQKIATSQIRCLVFSCEDFSASCGINSQVSAVHQDLLRQLDPHLLVFNKSDLMPNFEVPTHLGFTGPAIVVSAADKAGLQMLVENIAKALAPELPKEDQWFPVSSWQRDQLQLILQRLNDGDIEAAASPLQQY